MKFLSRSLLFLACLSWPLAASGGALDAENAGPSTSSGGAIQSQVQADLNSCSKTVSKAKQCCTDPLSCAEGMSPQAQQQLTQLLGMGAMGAMAFMQQGGDSSLSPGGIAAICGLLGTLGNLGSGVNSGAADVCEKNRTACTSSCQASLDKWKAKQQACSSSGCSDLQAINNAVTTMEQNVSSCTGLQANTAAMQTQASSTGSAAQLGQLCAQLAGMMNQQEETATTASTVVDCNDPANAANPLCIDCQANPENVACGKPADTTGKLTMEDGSSLSAADFNTGSGLEGLNQDAQYGAYKPQGTQSGTVSGSGGGIPGGGNNGGGFGENAMGQQQAAGYNTDIMGGTRGGGGYSVSGMGVDTSGGFSGYGGYERQENDPEYQGMDLKKYLPGGEMDPSRRLAGTLVTTGQINGKNTNIFESISQRIKAVCSTNRLKDCEKKKTN